MHQFGNKYHIILLFILGLLSLDTHAQSKQDSLQSNLIEKFIKPSSDTLWLDSLSIVPGSLQVKKLSSTEYNFDPIKGYFVFKNPEKIGKDSVQITYRQLPISIAKSYFHKNPDIIEKNVLMGGSYSYDGAAANKSSGQFIDFNTLDYSGNYGRSLSVGNNQDVVLNSQFNLQINGYLLDSIKVEAAITDNNIPFQPEGNTQRLQEFDKIFITFSKREHKLTLGDFALTKPNNYFLNYNKRVQGIQYSGAFWQNQKIKNKVGLSASMAKGQFSRNIFQGIEGNQGPYKLTGQNAEQYFIVLAGSEKVFIDNELLTRGEDQDYIINYNLGEITFMPRRMITKDKRIQVEFEYQARSYLNTLVQLSDEVQVGEKLNLRFNYYANQDGKNHQYTQTLSDDQERFLSTIGDSIDLAYYSTARLDTFAANKILYRKIDTLVNRINYTDVYVYSTDPSSAVYSLGFSFIGEGKGNYIISALNTNGRSYTWIAPENGIPQGNYEPKVLLITPKKLEVLSAGGTFKIDSLKSIDFEWAGSNYSPNTFSNINNNMHWGNAWRMNYLEARPIKKDSADNIKLKWESGLSYEFVDNRFEAIAPFRNVEFNRDWNIAYTAKRSNENILDFNTGLVSDNNKYLKYRYTLYRRDANFKGNRHMIDGLWSFGRFKAGTKSSVLFTDGALEHSFFLRPSAYFEVFTSANKKSLMGFKFEKEHNALRENASDSLSLNAYDFDVSRLYFRTDASQAVKLELAYNYRRDFKPIAHDFILANSGHSIEAMAMINKWKNHQISFNTTYRVLSYQYNPNQLFKNENTLIGRISYNGNIKNGFFTPNLLYDFGTGQEQKRQYTFVEVAAGQGTHMWVDYNNDGVQQANEFEIAIYPDQKRFVKIFTPTNDYVKVNFANLNLSFQLMPENIWRKVDKKNGWQRFGSRFSDQFSLQLNNKILQTEGLKVFNPLQVNFTDTAVVSTYATLANTFYFNRSSTTWGTEYTTSINRSQALLTYGLETLLAVRHTEKTRWIVNRNLSFVLSGLKGTRSFRSPIDDNRTYEIDYLGLEPSAIFIYSNRFRITTTYKFETRKNLAVYGGEQAWLHNVSLETKWSTPSTGNLLARASYSQISFNGLPNTPLSIAMLETLSKGNNWLWYLNWTTRLSKTIEFSIEYDGRKIGNTATSSHKVIHTGSMSLRAVL